MEDGDLRKYGFLNGNQLLFGDVGGYVTVGMFQDMYLSEDLTNGSTDSLAEDNLLIEVRDSGIL